MKNKKRRTTLSKFMALCMAAVMILSMSVTAFAQIGSDTKATVTVNGLESDEGATVTAYQIANVKFDTDSQQLLDPVYTWVNEVADWLRGTGSAYGQYIGAGDSVTKTYMTLSAAEEKKFLKALNEAALGLTEAGNGTIEDGNATFDLPMGQYMVIVTKDGVTSYEPLTVNIEPEYDNVDGWKLNPVTVSVKGSQPSIGKDVDESQDGSYAIGDEVKYKITADIPSYPSDAINRKFEVADKLSDGLTLDKNSIEVKVGDNSLELNTDYTIEYNKEITVKEEEKESEVTVSFLIKFKYEKVVEKAAGKKQVTVTYSATVNDNAFTEDALGNDAFLGFANDPFDNSDYDTTPIHKDVYTYGFTVDKKDSKDKSTALSGAQFKLSKNNGMTPCLEFVKEGEGVYRLAKADEVDKVQTLNTNSNGRLTVQGLDLGKYYLKETKAPDGYILPEKPFEITLTDKDSAGEKPDGILDTGATGISGTAINGIDTVDTQVTIDGTKPSSAGFTVYNVTTKDAGFQLPKTGGMGTMIFTVCGILLMGGAVGMVVLLLGKKKRESR